MLHDDFRFLTYRLNKVFIEKNTNLFLDREVENDIHILDIINTACNEKYDTKQKTSTAIYSWSIRHQLTQKHHSSKNPELSILLLTRSTLEHDVQVLEKNNLVHTRSISSPPPAEAMHILIYWKRHIVLVENRSQMTTGETWLKHFTPIIKKVAIETGYNKTFELEPIAPEKELINTYKSFDIINRVKVSVRIPNPDLSRFTKELKEELERDGINELTQEFKSDFGLSKDEGSRPFRSIAMANDGYKTGNIHIEGIKNGQEVKYESNRQTATGTLKHMKAYIKGMGINTKTKEGRTMLEAIEAELNRVCPKEN